MNTLELKNILIEEINQIEDKSFLNALRTIVELKIKKENLYEEYNSEILLAEEDIEKGYTISHNEVKAKIDEWKKK
jgi:predicted transcriptional regulator